MCSYQRFKVSLSTQIVNNNHPTVILTAFIYFVYYLFYKKHKVVSTTLVSSARCGSIYFILKWRTNRATID